MARKESSPENRKILKALLDADNDARQTVEQARQKAKRIVEKAEQQAEAVEEKAISEAEAEAEKIIDEAGKDDFSKNEKDSSPSSVFFSEEQFSKLSEKNMEDAVNYLVNWVAGKG